MATMFKPAAILKIYLFKQIQLFEYIYGRKKTMLKMAANNDATLPCQGTKCRHWIKYVIKVFNIWLLHKLNNMTNKPKQVLC